MCNSAEHFMYVTRSLLGNSIPIKTKMDARKASQFVFWNTNFSAVLRRFHTSSSQNNQYIYIFVSTKGLREIWPWSEWTEHYKIFVTSWHQLVNWWPLCEEFHKFQQWLPVFHYADFTYLLWENYDRSRVLILQAAAYDCYSIPCIRITPDST